MTQVREQRDELLQRVPRLQLLFLALLFVIGTSYGFVQVVRGDYYRELADNNRTRTETILAPRGLVYDRTGHVLAENTPRYDLLLDLERTNDLAGSLAFAAEVLGRGIDELSARVDSGRRRQGYERALLAEELTLTEVARFTAVGLERPEFVVDAGHRRLYRYGSQTAHTMGYVGEASEAEIEASQGDLRAGDLVGKKGVERAFDGELRGRDGERVLTVDSHGRAREEHLRQGAENGGNLRLTLDLALQQEAARYFADPAAPKAGAVVALDARTGEVRAMVSAPSYDPNIFSRRLDQEQWLSLLEAPGDPLQNRALQNAHSPGSVFKIVMGTAGLSSGLVRPSDQVYCSGSLRIYNRQTRCWKRGGHGAVGLYEAIKQSCDVYFYTLGQRLGINEIARYARLFGLGEPTRFDIPGERRGLVPDSQWSLAVRKTPWYPGETVSVAIGQGPILATPLQIAVMTAVVANGGYRVVPHVLEGAAGTEPQRVDLDPAVLQQIRRALWGVVNDGGTGARARVQGVEIAGKTGTVQVVRQATWTASEDLEYKFRDHAWFAAYAPAADPELVVVVFVEHGGHGSSTAGPLVKRLYETYFAVAAPG